MKKFSPGQLPETRLTFFGPNQNNFIFQRRGFLQTKLLWCEFFMGAAYYLQNLS